MLRTIREFVDFQAAKQPDAVYLIAAESGMSMTFAELQRASRRLSHYLSGLGIRPGEKVALFMHNGYQACRLFIGAMYGGFCITPINLQAQASQLEYVLEHRIKIVCCDVDAREFIAGPDEAHDLPEVGEEDDALMMYTSGTTGKPKGVVLAHRSVVSGGQFVSAAHELGPNDRVLASLPLYHINAQIVTATSPLIHGGSLVMPHRFSVSQFWDLAAQYRCTWINVVPTIISYLLNGPDPVERGLDIGRVRFCRSASAPLAPSQHRAFEDKFKIGVIETMGLTETAAPCFTNPLDPAKRKIGSPGQAFGNQAKTVDPQGNTLPSRETGEILVRGPNVMKGYYKDPEETARTSTADGWLRTGDLGHLDEDGFVFVTGRIKELIIKGGENIAPREIDEALLKHPGVLEAAATGIPDPHYGQEIMACVVMKPGQLCSEAELLEFCLPALGKYKTPKVIRFLSELPKGPSGKVQRLKLLG
ncbi:MAG: AMP-binding protein [Proteobacteria bacterium]|nr:AMP-binding protein [Pseudomonadota bacterium]